MVDSGLAVDRIGHPIHHLRVRPGGRGLPIRPLLAVQFREDARVCFAHHAPPL